jgi:hypothetical protein
MKISRVEVLAAAVLVVAINLGVKSYTKAPPHAPTWTEMAQADRTLTVQELVTQFNGGSYKLKGSASDYLQKIEARIHETTIGGARTIYKSDVATIFNEIAFAEQIASLTPAQIEETRKSKEFWNQENAKAEKRNAMDARAGQADLWATMAQSEKIDRVRGMHNSTINGGYRPRYPIEYYVREIDRSLIGSQGLSPSEAYALIITAEELKSR